MFIDSIKELQRKRKLNNSNLKKIIPYIIETAHSKCHRQQAAKKDI